MARVTISILSGFDGPEARLGEELPGARLVLRALAVAGELGEVLVEQPPHAPRLGRHGGADDGAARECTACT